MPKIKDLQGMSIKKVAMIVGIITGSITIGIFAGDIYKNVGSLIVTDTELDVHEQRIISKIHTEAVLTRNVFIRDLEERKTKLTENLDKADTAGLIAKILQEIEVINGRIKELKGE